MRSAIYVIVTLVLLVGGFVVFLKMQAPVAVSVREQRGGTGAVTRPATQDSRMGIGQGENVWVVRHDPDTGRLAERFRAARFDPTAEGPVKVDRPEAEFFLDEGRVLRVSGKTGRVEVEGGAGGGSGKRRGFGGGAGTDTPTRGDLKDVMIRLFEAEGDAEPVLTVSLDNATYDTQTNRIFTEAAEIGGKRVERDEIPVKVRGVDYDFDGRGLTIRWDQRERKLQRLEVAHGEQLTIKRPRQALREAGKGASTQGAKGEATTQGVAEVSGGRSDAPSLKSEAPGNPSQISNPKSQTRASTRKGATKPGVGPRGLQVYRAAFVENVKVVQGAVQLVDARELQVDFAAEGARGAAEGKETAGAEAPDLKLEAVNGKAEISNLKSQPADGAPSAAAAAPASAPVQAKKEAGGAAGVALSDEPIVIRWTGPLTVTPAEGSGDIVADTRGQVVRMLGSPVVVRQKDAEIRGGALAYGTADERLIGRGTPEMPLTMKSGDGGVVETEAIEFLRREGRALLSGRGRVSKPLKGDKGEVVTLRTEWSRACALWFTEGDAEQMGIKSAELEGDVKVDHPQLKVESQKLTLAFEQEAGGKKKDAKGGAAAPGADTAALTSNLKEVHASGGVRAQVVDSQGKRQALESQTLDVRASRTPEGAFYAEEVVADGSVRAFDAEQELRTGRLVAHMGPGEKVETTKPTATGVDLGSAQLKDLTADGGVQIRGRDATGADGKRLEVVMGADAKGPPKLVRLTGEPAVVVKGENRTTGGVIEMNPKTQEYEVKGPGQMHLVREDGKNSPPVDVGWQQGVKARLAENVIDVAKDVTVESTGADGTRSTARAQNLKVTLADKPAAKLKKKDDAGAAAADSGGGGLFNSAADADVMRDKEPQALQLSGGVLVRNIRGDEAGNLLTQFDLRSEVVDYHIPQQKLIVPVPGSVFFYDDREAAKKEAASKPKGADPLGAGGGDRRGKTALAWQGELVYDQIGGTVAINKDVRMVHEPKDPKQQPLRMEADNVTVDLLKTGEKAAEQPSPDVDKINVKRLAARGKVHVVGQNVHFLAESAEYDPVTGIFTARGTDRVPAQVLGEDNASQGTFTELRYDLRTQQVKMEGFKGAVRQGK